MKKLSNKLFLFFFITAVALISCNLKKSKEAIPEVSEITETISIKDNTPEINENIENPKPRNQCGCCGLQQVLRNGKIVLFRQFNQIIFYSDDTAFVVAVTGGAGAACNFKAVCF